LIEDNSFANGAFDANNFDLNDQPQMTYLQDLEKFPLYLDLEID